MPSMGLGGRLNEMHAWCRKNIAAGQWEQHGHRDNEQRDDRGIPIDFARFYFVSEADAEAFRRRWRPSGT